MLKHIHLHIREGEFVAIVGPSGGGKSTLCFSINGLIPNELEGAQVEGTIEVDGINVHSCMPQQLIPYVGTVLQDPEWQLVRSTVLEELTFTLENLGLPIAEIESRLQRVVELTGIGDLLRRSPLELSGGQKQKVAIACCLILQPKVLMLDEPTAELDPLGKEMVMQLLKRLNREHGQTILFVDHNLDVTLPHATRVIVIAEGEVKADSPTNRLYDTAQIDRWIAKPQIVEIKEQLALDPRLIRHILTADELAAHLAPDYHRFVGQKGKGGARRISGMGLTTAGTGADAQATPPLAELKSASFRYPSTDERVVRAMNLTVSRGEFAAVVGHNGAGKSTMCKLLVGLLRPTAGEALINGKPARSYSSGELVRHIGYVFQNPDYQIFMRTVFDEIAFGMKLQKLPDREIKRRVQEVSELLGIGKHLKEHPHFLSRGERRRVAIASMLAMRPQLLILDEPTTGLDSIRCREMMAYIVALWKNGHSILLLTHDMRIVAEHAPRTILIAQGQVRFDGPTRRFFADHELLADSGVTPPPVVQLCRRLGWSEPALNTGEYVSKSLASGPLPLAEGERVT